MVLQPAGVLLQAREAIENRASVMTKRTTLGVAKIGLGEEKQRSGGEVLKTSGGARKKERVQEQR